MAKDESRERNWLPMMMAVVGLACVAMAVGSMLLTVHYSNAGASQAHMQPVIERAESILEKLETMDNRRNAQYGQLKSLMEDRLPPPE